ncbi:DUF1592 domain-containing protein [Luteolibacter marinus]|uniref:DUF1592 domain-containing protein n=1 Tax=Luteolibacter marinus TaxID=2776705 RepID=UPI001866EC8F|nr:DUF1592 domain-containing protein [Luteolibacter marinus]
MKPRLAPILLALGAPSLSPAIDEAAFQATIRPILEDYCIDCHSAKRQKGDLDLERFATVADIRADPGVWQHVEEQLDLDEMPPRDKTQPLAGEEETLRSWVRATLKEIARESAGDPGPVVVRRLSNAEYTYTLRDLTGIDSLDPAREFPVDGAAGEGFTNAGAALVMSPALFTKYLDAGKEVAAHAVLLPDGIGFSEKVTRRDWSEEKLKAIRDFYGRFVEIGEATRVSVQEVSFQSKDAGVIPLEKYFEATFAIRDGGDLEEIAGERGLSPKYLRTLWSALNDPSPSPLLEVVRRRWRESNSSAETAATVRTWQKALWRFETIERVGRPGGPQKWQQPAAPGELDEALRKTVPDGMSLADLAPGFDAFRELFPAALCYERIVPIDSVVTLLLYFREDEQLRRLMLDDAQAAELERMWHELHFVSESALRQVDVYEQVWQFVTQGGENDPAKNPLNPLREPIMKRAEDFRAERIAVEPAQLDGVLDFAGKAWRRPLAAPEKDQLRGLYQQLRDEELPHDDSIRLLIARVLAAPAFLYKLESPAAGERATPVSDLELATRLSYFLTSSTPDDELKALAAEGKLGDPDVLAAQAKRLLSGPEVRRMAIEFGAQWLHVRDFDQLDEKSETHFPGFAAIRADLDEEPVRYFTDFFQNDGSVTGLLDADHTFVNGRLANYYGIPGIEGDEWRRVDGLREHGRGGVLGFGATLAMQSGASRTSPILRGNWICETLLGEKLPRPPKGVPTLPEQPPAGLTERQFTAQHSEDPKCSRCHLRIDPFGFSLEEFDAIGRFRSVDAAGLAIDASAKTPDGAEFTGIDGLRAYLMNKRGDDFVRQFCKKLLGYALGRGVMLSDEPLLDEIQERLAENDHRVSIAIEMIVRSPQFREIRGRDFVSNDPNNP